MGGGPIISWRRQWHPTPVLLPGKSHGRRSLVGCSPWGCQSQTRLSDFTFTFHFHALEKETATHSSVLGWRQPTPVFLAGESQGRGAWWTAIYRVAQSRTRLKRLSSSSSNIVSQEIILFMSLEILIQGQIYLFIYLFFWRFWVLIAVQKLLSLFKKILKICVISPPWLWIEL